MAKTKIEKPLLNEIHGLKNLALEESFRAEEWRRIGHYKIHSVRAAWRADSETFGDTVMLVSSNRYLGSRALRDTLPTLMYVSDTTTGYSDEYEIDFRLGSIGLLTAVKGYSIRGRLAEIRGSREESAVGFNSFDDERQELMLTELRRGASGLYAYGTPEPPIDGTINTYE